MPSSLSVNCLGLMYGNSPCKREQEYFRWTVECSVELNLEGKNVIIFETRNDAYKDLAPISNAVPNDPEVHEAEHRLVDPPRHVQRRVMVQVVRVFVLPAVAHYVISACVRVVERALGAVLPEVLRRHSRSLRQLVWRGARCRGRVSRRLGRRRISRSKSSR